MDFFNVLTMIGGLALFLFGMNLMGDGLSKVSGGKLERILEKLTSNPIKAVLLGAGVTAVIQSSSATTVMVVGFVNSGIMKLSQAVGVIMGANIGTTITSWILSLSGIESENFFIQLLKPTSFSPVLAVIGVILIMFSKKEKKNDIGTVLIGFAILMFGMESMSGAVAPLADVPEFTNILTMFSNPFLGMLAGAVLTAVIQSSSASVGILQVLCKTGSLKYSTALPVIMGQNIGTCVTALISSVGATKNAKRAALIHLYFNIIGTTLFMVVFYVINAINPFAFLEESAGAAGIAVIHSLFNVCATVVLLPFSRVIEKLAIITIKNDSPQSDVSDEFKTLDMRFIDKPGLAMEQCENVSKQMALLCKKALLSSINMIWNYNEDMVIKINAMENKVDRYEDELGSYMVKLSSKNLSEKESKLLTELLHCIGDFERISDHAINICEASKEMHDKNISFSKEAREEFITFSKAIEEILTMAIDVFLNDDIELAKSVEPLEEVVDKLNVEIKKRHIKRLTEGKCTIEMGFVLADLSTNFERVADHCSNIAVCLIQSRNDGFEAHEYLDTLDKGENTKFRELYTEYKEKYRLQQAAV